MRRLMRLWNLKATCLVLKKIWTICFVDTIQLVILLCPSFLLGSDVHRKSKLVILQYVLYQ